MNVPPVVSHAEWLERRRQLLVKEKEFTRLRDQLSAELRELPWEKVEKAYSFSTSSGPQSLADLFDGQAQLIVYHFMFDPSWDAGCKSCSFWADNFDGIDVHLRHRDTNFVAISRAPLEKIQAYQKRMGWQFSWVSSFGSTFNFDYGVSFTPEEVELGGQYNYTHRKPFGTESVGISVFAKGDDGDVFHTYSCYSRGVDIFNTAYHFLDVTPKGRNEGGRNQFWVRRHDEYDE